MPDNKDSIFVGRRAQLSELKDYWHTAFYKNQGSVIFLVGEAGIGKTALIEQFSQNILKYYSGIQYAYAQCDQVAGDVSPYAPFIQILNNLTEQAAKKGDNWFVDYMREIGPDILGMVPAVGSLLTTAAKSLDFVWQRRHQKEEPPQQFGQQDIFQQFTNSFLNIAIKKNPLLICIDDWHWADTSSTNLLFNMARQLNKSPILLLATYRPDDAKVREHPILNVRAEMERYKLCASIELEFLNRDEIVSYLNHRFPKNQIKQDFVDWLLNITSGNALFTTEYIKLLLKENLLTNEGQLIGDLNQIAPPTNVEAVIRTRIGYLDRDARDMLAYGSVEGEQFTTLLLSRLLDIKPLSLIGRLRTIEETHQLIASLGHQSVYEQQTTVYRFVHALIHRTLYNMLETEERKEIHRLLLELRGEIYNKADDVTKLKLLPDLMTHAAEAQDYLAQGRYALAAAREALQNYAHVEALKHCSIGLQALAKIAKPETEITNLRLRLLINRGWTEGFMGDLQQAIETNRQAETLARELGDNLRLFWILNTMGFDWRNLENYDQARYCYEEAISLAIQMDDKAKLGAAYHGLADIYWKQGQPEQALEWAQKALTISEETGNKYALAQSYHQMGLVYKSLGNHDLALDWFQRATAINKELENKGALAWNYMNIASIYHSQGNDEQSISFYQQALAICREIGDRRGESIIARGLGRIYLDLNDPDQAMVCYRNALNFWEKAGSKTEIMWAHQGIGGAYFQQGKYDQALEQYQTVLALGEEGEISYGLAGVYYNIGLIHKARGEFNQALERLEEAFERWHKVDNKQAQAKAIQNMGNIYETQGNYKQAIVYYKKAMTIRKKLGHQKDITEIRECIAALESKIAGQKL
jgi:tetratricopeptide (TPR) repeat protein